MAKMTWRIWLLIIALLLSLLAIKPSFESGVSVKSVEKNSTLFNDGLRAGEVITSINGQVVKNKAEYAQIIDNTIFTKDTRIDIKTKTGEYTSFVNGPPEITVEDLSKTRIQTGLDLRGGARALVEPDVKVTDAQLDDLIQVSRNRFNVYGLSDVNIKAVTDLTGNKFMLVEVAGATPADLETLIAQQGKFEAKVGNVSVFQGGKQDISGVCKTDAKCSGVQTPFQQSDGSYAANFMFSVYLTEDAAKRHAKVTENISTDETGKYLSEKLYLYVDDTEVDSLLIGIDLKGQVTTEITIQGSGTGKTEDEAIKSARENMNKLQTVLITGSLPYKLKVAKLDTISPLLGDQFTYQIIIAGVGALILVGIIILIRYRKIKESLALLLTSFSEVIIILGLAALLKWNLDLPSIAGILATIGTGVDQQIVILDEARKGIQTSLKEKMKKALFIVVSAYFTALVAMVPLFWAGAGLFKGFAFTTIIGITAGVLITRPAFSDMIRNIEEKN
jgi:preprotein translocase subunit SecD